MGGEFCVYGVSGAGGFGGGGGGGRANFAAAAPGGFGGGAGAVGASSTEAGVGGGGAGLGGAIFVMEGGSLVVRGTLTINGNQVAPGPASGAAEWGMAFGSGLFLHGDGELVFEPAAGELQSIDDEIADMSGSGGTASNTGSWALVKRGAGTLRLAGANSFTGGVFVYDGALRIGPGPSPLASGRLTLHGGVVRPETTTTLANRVTLGTLGVGGGVVIDLSDASLGLEDIITGQGGLTVGGGNFLALTATNFYGGGTIVRDGATVLITTDANLGAAAGRLTLNGGTLRPQGPIGSSRPITIGELGGTIHTSVFNAISDGPFDGPGELIKRGMFTVALYGVSTRTGPLRVAEGRLRVGHETVLWPTAPVTVDAAGVLEILGVQPTIGSLSGTGNVTLGSAAALTIGGGASTTFAGTIAGSGVLIKSGAGALTLAGISAFTGRTTIESGAMNVTGALASSAFVIKGGTLTVAGTTGAVTMSAGTLAVAGGTTGTVTMSGGTVAGAGTIGAVTMSGGTLAATGTIGGVTMNGGTLSSSGSELVVNGGVMLSGDATLQVSVTVTPAPGMVLVIIDNDGADPITGTFAGLPEGSILTLGPNSDVRLRLSYIGGSGNDVVLQRVAPEVETLTWYLAEGATGEFFDFDLLLANPRSEPVPVTIEFLTDTGATITRTQTLPATSRTTIHVDEIAGLEAAAVSTVVTSTAGVPIVVERTMRWDASGYGAHTEKATAGAAPVWYFAEGSQGFFSTYFLLVNPHDTANAAHVTWLRQGEPALVRDYPLGPRARLTIDAGQDSELVDRSFGAQIVFDQPAMAERAMYFGRDPLFSGGHEAAGATSPSTHWFLAEGATGSYFTTYILLANPNDTETTATLTYLPASGIPVIREHVIPPKQRVTINIALEDASLASAAVATRVTSPLPLIVERAQYWPNPTWNEAHASVGVTETATTWGLAEGRVGGPNGYQTYILLANSEAQPADVTLTFLRADGTTLVKTFRVGPTSRFNVGVTGPDGEVPELADESFGTLIESTQPIVVERSMYSNANGIVWAAGTNATATRVP